MNVRFFVLFFFGAAFGETHVNISIAQHPLENIAAYKNNRNEESLAQLKDNRQDAGFSKVHEDLLNENGYSRQTSNVLSQRNINFQRNNQNGLPKHLNRQEKQNQEFERYIENFHSGPTVETIYDTTNASPQLNQKSFSSKSTAFVHISPKMKQTHTFEKQIAISNPEEETLKNINVNEDQQNSNKFFKDQNIGVNPSKTDRNSIKDSLNFDQTNLYTENKNYEKQNMTPSDYIYENNGLTTQGYDYEQQNRAFFENPTSEDENVGGHGYYYEHANDGNYRNVDSNYENYPYHPNYQRPIVTKTIQIVQPALKAKKFEIRHPAIQKEFYDIEERVLIKPAGTIVVELEHPVAKIPKGESILPLGHPHPAVADAYIGNGKEVIQVQSSSVGSFHNNNSYIPQNDFIPNTSSHTMGSAVTTTPIREKVALNEQSHNNRNQQFGNNEQNYANEEKMGKDTFLVKTDTNENDKRIFNKNLTPKMLVYSDQEFQKNAQTKDDENDSDTSSYDAERSSFNVYNNDNSRHPAARLDQYYNNNNNNNKQKGRDFNEYHYLNLNNQRSARLQQHNIYLPPSQHNIYVAFDADTLDGQPSANKNEKENFRKSNINDYKKNSQVTDTKSYLEQSKDPVVVYASTTTKPKQYISNTHDNLDNNNHKLEYSFPYSRMRHHPKESVKIVKNVDENLKAKMNEDHSKSEDEIFEQNKRMHSNAHIQIKIPKQDEQNKSIFIASTFGPLVVQKENSEYDTTNNNLKNNNDNDFSSVNLEHDKNSQSHQLPQRKFMRIVEESNEVNKPHMITNINPNDLEVDHKSSMGHVIATGSRVISATPAPKDASLSSESFHKRRIVVNHPFQTVREVVEHEPITNYHQIKVSEPASPAIYHMPYVRHHDDLRKQHEIISAVHHH